MNKKTSGFVLIALGVVMAAVSLAADVIGIGTEQGIAWLQLLGVAIGIIVAAFGTWLAFGKPAQK